MRAQVTFVPEDVLTVATQPNLGILMDLDSAADWLSVNRRVIEDRISALGREVIEQLLAADF